MRNLMHSQRVQNSLGGEGNHALVTSHVPCHSQAFTGHGCVQPAAERRKSMAQHKILNFFKHEDFFLPFFFKFSFTFLQDGLCRWQC